MKNRELLEKHTKNNFDFIRFLAASCVIISHSVPLTGNGISYFSLFTKGQIDLGAFCVAIFFIVSGYLITISWINLKNILSFFTFRILRIMPALAVVTFITVFIVGPSVTSVSIKTYFLSPFTYSYLKNIFLYHHMQYELTGFDALSPTNFRKDTNGSLWTLPCEFFCYSLLAFFGFFKILKKQVVFFIFLLSVFFELKFNVFFHGLNKSIAYIKVFEQVHNMFMLMTYFFAGSFFYLYRDNIVYKFRYFLIALSVIILSALYGNYLNLALPVFGGYAVFYLAFFEKIKLQRFGKYGDFSYGIYIYGFLIQQLVIFYFHGKMNNTLNYCISLPLAIICGILSYHFVEKPMISLKKYIKKIKVQELALYGLMSRNF